MMMWCLLIFEGGERWRESFLVLNLLYNTRSAHDPSACVGIVANTFMTTIHWEAFIATS